MNTCTVGDCEKPRRSGRALYCEMHYYRLRRNGTTDPLKPWNRHEGTCKVDDCESPVDDRWGMCKMHATRVARHGDPLVVIHQRDRDLPRGEQHHSWTGAEATYDAAHSRVHAQRGRASDHLCADCDGQASQWSYDHSDPDERVSEAGYAYSLDVNHYAPRCVSCHKQHDCAFILQERGGAFSTAPRCGKPIRSTRILSQLGHPDPPPACGRPVGHGGTCSLPETYQRELEYNRKRTREATRAADGQMAGPKPRCGCPLQVKRGREPDVCGRPTGHSGRHLGTVAYRRGLDRTRAAEKRQAKEREAA